VADFGNASASKLTMTAEVLIWLALDLRWSKVPDHIQVEMRPSSTARFKATRHQRSLGVLTAPAFRIGSLREPRQVQRCFHCARRFPKAINVRFDRRHRADPGSDRLYYIIELYRELIAESGAPSLGTQNQVVASPACRSRRRWRIPARSPSGPRKTSPIFPRSAFA